MWYIIESWVLYLHVLYTGEIHKRRIWYEDEFRKSFQMADKKKRISIEILHNRATTKQQENINN